MLKAKSFNTTTMNALTSTKKKKILASLILKKKNIILHLFLSLLVDDCILMYLETIILYIYNFFNIIWMPIWIFFLYTLVSANLKL